MKSVLTWLIVIACLAGLFVAKDYLPKRSPPDVRAAERALADSKRSELRLENKLEDAERRLAQTRQMVAETDAPLKRDSLAYDFAKTHLDTTSTDSLKAQVRRGETVIADQRSKIAALEADTASKAQVILKQNALLIEKDQKAAALDRLNAGIRAEIPTRVQQLRHDAKVATLTGATLLTLKFVFGR